MSDLPPFCSAACTAASLALLPPLGRLVAPSPICSLLIVPPLSVHPPGSVYEPLAELLVQGDAILLPGHAWSEQLLPLLMDVAASSSCGDELPMVETDGELQSFPNTVAGSSNAVRRRASPSLAMPLGSLNAHPR